MTATQHLYTIMGFRARPPVDGEIPAHPACCRRFGTTPWDRVRMQGVHRRHLVLGTAV
ncbi:MAG: hypothetical protein ACHQ4F_09635 [Candidatus Dormibacteria bacterium]